MPWVWSRLGWEGRRRLCLPWLCQETWRNGDCMIQHTMSSRLLWSSQRHVGSPNSQTSPSSTPRCSCTTTLKIPRLVMHRTRAPTPTPENETKKRLSWSADDRSSELDRGRRDISSRTMQKAPANALTKAVTNGRPVMTSWGRVGVPSAPPQVVTLGPNLGALKMRDSKCANDSATRNTCRYKMQKYRTRVNNVNTGN